MAVLEFLHGLGDRLGGQAIEKGRRHAPQGPASAGRREKRRPGAIAGLALQPGGPPSARLAREGHPGPGEREPGRPEAGLAQATCRVRSQIPGGTGGRRPHNQGEELDLAEEHPPAPRPPPQVSHGEVPVALQQAGRIPDRITT